MHSYYWLWVIRWFNRGLRVPPPLITGYSTAIKFLHQLTGCLAVSGCQEHPWITCQHSKPSTPMERVACESKLRSVVRSMICGRIHAQETRWQSGVRSCIMPGLPMHLMQELNVGTVVIKQPDCGNKMTMECTASSSSSSSSSTTTITTTTTLKWGGRA